MTTHRRTVKRRASLLAAAMLGALVGEAALASGAGGGPTSMATSAGVAAAAEAMPPAAEPAPGVAAEQAGGVPLTQIATLDALPYPVAAAAVGSSSSSAPFEAPMPFAMVGLELPGTATARVRASADGTTWGAWQAAERLVDDDGPDAGSSEAGRAVDARSFTEPLWVGEARWLQVELVGAAPDQVAATFIDTLGLSGAARAGGGGDDVAAAHSDSGFPAPTMPGVTTRERWGAQESLRNGAPTYALGGVRYAVVHHTAGGNDYSPSEAPAVVRGILSYHTEVLGWDDIGYNVLVDRYGKVYEGRAGGFDAAVVGAHAQGFNTGSVGVAVLGEFSTSPPPSAALDAVAGVLAWTFERHGVDPSGGVLITSGGSNRYPVGERVPMSTIFGHRDAGRTMCPGSAYYARLPALRSAVRTKAAALPPLPPAPSVAPGRGPSFSDLGGTVHARNIEALARAGITGGCRADRFCPEADVTRAQAVTFITRAAGLPSGTTPRFTDVSSRSTHAAAIGAAVTAGFVRGYGDGSFRPDASVTRAELATMVARAKGLARQAGRRFPDVPWSSVHLANVNAIADAGLTAGCGGGRYCPFDNASRAEMATFVVKAFS